MQILFINNHGGGFAGHVEVPEGSTVQQVFARRCRGASRRTT